MTPLIFWAAFAAGLATLGWVSAGYFFGHALALTVMLLIAACYLAGVWELLRHQRATAALTSALHALTSPPANLDGWLATLPDGLRTPVRQRIEGTRTGLPGPALASYLTGLLVLLGMLGTFLGMVVTLHGTGAALLGAQGLDAIRNALSAPMQGLGLAFGTSVAGVAASAALGLMAALARRERLRAAQQLDAALGAALRPFTPQHQRESSLRLMEQQAALLPELVERISTCMLTLERQQTALTERLGAEQARFHHNTEAAFTGLASSVERALIASAAESARHAGAAIEPAVQAALAGLARESAQLQAAQAEQVRGQLDGLAERFGQATEVVATQWTSALSTHQRTSEAATEALREALAQFATTFETRSAALADGLTQQLTQQAQTLTTQWGQALAEQTRAGEQLAAQHQQALQTAAQGLAQHAATLHTGVEQAHTSLQRNLAEQDEARRAAWTASLQTLAERLHADWQQASAQASSQWQQLGQLLGRAASDMGAQAEAQTTRLLALMEQRATQDEARHAAWTQSLHELGSRMQADWQQASAQASSQWQQLGQLLGRAASDMGTQAEAQTTRLLALMEQRATQDEARHAAWTQSLHELGSRMQADWQQAGVQASSQWQQLGELLGRAGSDMGAKAEAQTTRLLTLMEQRATQDEARHAAWTQSLHELGSRMQADWQQASAQAATQWQGLGDTLTRTADGMTQQLQAQAQSTLGEIGTLVQAAAEAPRAAAQIMGELRQQLSDSMQRDTAMLEERSRILETLSTLLDAVNHASVQQRSAIDALVSTSADLMERASARFADTVEAQATRVDAAATQLSGSAVEVASLGEVFGASVERFGEVNEQLGAQLQRIEAALAQSLARSDEQLGYYVAQAREVIELSVGAQKQIIDELQQLARERAA